MGIETIALIVFVILLAILVFIKRQKLDTKFLVPYFLYFSMYKTSWGLKWMDSAAQRFRKIIIYLGYFGIIIGFIGMILIGYSLLDALFKLFTHPEAESGVGLVLPVKAKGIFYVPFFYWIIAIFVIAFVHEFAHGLVARAHNLKVKSSGFAFVGSGFRGAGILISIISLYLIARGSLQFQGINMLSDFSSPYSWLIIGIILVVLSYVKSLSLGGIPVIPAAFVEPDEKELRKRPHKEQLSVFAAGPLANITAAFMFLAIFLLIIAPLASNAVEADGVKITGYAQGNQTFPAEMAGIGKGEIIKEIDNKPIQSLANLSDAFKAKHPGDMAAIKTNSSTYQLKLVSNPKNASAAFMGATLEQNTKINENIKAKYGEFLPKALIWVYGLFIILIALNFGIGLFNLVPIGPLDGGRMLQLPLQKYLGKDRGNRMLAYVSLIFLIIVVVNLSASFGALNFLR